MTSETVGRMDVDLPHLTRDRDRHGNVRIYYRKRGATRKIRIRAAPGTDAFLQEYQAAEQAFQTTAATQKYDTLNWLCAQYYNSVEFKAFAPLTRSTRSNHLNNLCAEHGAKRFRNIRRKHVVKLRDAKAETPGAANGMLKALSALFSWAVQKEHVEVNPVTGVKHLDTRSNGFEPWDASDCAKYEAKHPTGTKARLAYDLLRRHGIARADVVKLGRQHVSNGTLTFRRQKTGTLVQIPWECQDSIDATETGDLAFLVTAFGKPFTEAGFGNRFAEWCDQAGVSKRAHGLRKTLAEEKAELGWTASQLMAFFGWETLAEAERYTRKADRKRLAATGPKGHEWNKDCPTETNMCVPPGKNQAKSRAT